MLSLMFLCLATVDNNRLDVREGILEMPYNRAYVLHLPSGKKLQLCPHDWERSYSVEYERQDRLLHGHAGCRVVVTGRTENLDGIQWLYVLGVRPKR